jgi:proteasome lid subunit RPN8/RPN11
MIQLSASHIKEISIHAETAYPQECCGLLVGNLGHEDRQVVEVVATENSWNNDDFIGLSVTRVSKKNRFSIAPEMLLKVQKESRKRNLSIVGIYHSHPDLAAVPSEFDRKIAWPDYSYIIAAVIQGKVTDIYSWKLDQNHQFQSEKLKISEP